MSYFAPVEPLLLCAMAFVVVDFVTGVLADRTKTHRQGLTWHFESRKAWKTVRKLSFVMGGIVLAFMLDGLLEPIVSLRLANLFTGFVCGVEFWSYLENAATATGEELFSRFKAFWAGLKK